ncbi:MAG: caspase family protein, partial [Hyphomonas sp.]|nr:caspase family protein [Hyphomonas sp.]
MRGPWIAMTCLAASLVAQEAVAERRLALVIEESDYTGNLRDIAAAVSEADAVEAALTRTGFTVTRRRNATRAELETAFATFRQDVTTAGAPETVALVYFTGHGASDRDTGHSYLLGTDADISSTGDLARDGIQIAALRDAFDELGARSVILVFDACRDDGSLAAIAPQTKGMARKDAGAPGMDARGLEIVEAQNDMLIAYSTGVGDTAAEGVFAPVLTDAMTRPYQNIVSVFAWTQRRVARQTEGGQKPWTNNLLYGEDFCLVSCAPEYLLAAGEQAGLNAAQAKAILASFGYTDIPLEKWPEALAESAERLKELEAKYAATVDGEPAIMALRAEARAALDLADFVRADELLAEVERIAFAAGDRLTRIGVETAEQRGDIAYTEGRFVDAAGFYSRAADHVPRSEPLEWARLKFMEGNALYEQGQYDPETGLLQASVTAYREALKE